MEIQSNRTALIILLLVIAFVPFALKADAANDLVPWNSEKGLQRLLESKYKVDFFGLANHFQAQPNGVVCGPTTAAIVLNSLRLKNNDPRIPYTSGLNQQDGKYAPAGWDTRIRMYTPDNVIREQDGKTKTRAQIFGEPMDGKPDWGMQIRQLHQMFLSHEVASTLNVVDDDVPLETMRTQMMTNLKSENDFIVVNYARKILGQNGPGHISPVAAYHAGSDSLLILDVTSYEHNWVWVPAEKLHAAMKSFDTVENRGYLLIGKEEL